ncbi:MAG TPA: hypothetical protein VHY83_03875 [Solirubrobacteraceae bacterium]|nr:hypothetical protein [Solirubrobacteraceae bacterium]
MYPAFLRFVGLGSIVACVIVIASFVLFAVNQTSEASTHQQRLLSGEVTTASGEATPPATTSKKSSLRKTVDEASEWLTSPFDSLTSASNSQWANHAILLLLALAIYGFGVGFLARTLRVRV